MAGSLQIGRIYPTKGFLWNLCIFFGKILICKNLWINKLENILWWEAIFRKIKDFLWNYFIKWGPARPYLFLFVNFFQWKKRWFGRVFEGCLKKINRGMKSVGPLPPVYEIISQKIFNLTKMASLTLFVEKPAVKTFWGERRLWPEIEGAPIFLYGPREWQQSCKKKNTRKSESEFSVKSL